MATESYPTRFESALELDRLPWFEVRGGNLLSLRPQRLAA
jgi:hypothetical protein